jgi:hypothetical protein
MGESAAACQTQDRRRLVRRVTARWSIRKPQQFQVRAFPRRDGAPFALKELHCTAQTYRTYETYKTYETHKARPRTEHTLGFVVGRVRRKEIR